MGQKWGKNEWLTFG